MKHSQIVPGVLVAFAVLPLVLPLAGCGGGANAPVTVTYKTGDAEEKDDGGGGGGSTTTTDQTTGSGGVGTFKGRVVLDGTAPNLALLVSKGSDIKDKEVCAAEDVPDEKLVVGANNGVANAFVYLPRVKRGTPVPEAPVTPVTFDQKGCRFLPHALVMRTGQLVQVLSNDPIAHNTHTYPNKNTGFNELIPPSDREGQKTFAFRRAESEPVRVGCDFHSYMVAWMLPLDHPFAAVTGEDGSFEITGLPAGKYDFRVWHEAATGGYVSRKVSVTIKGDDTVEQEIKFAASALAL